MRESRISEAAGTMARSLWLLLVAVVVIAVVAVTALVWIDRPSGHAFLLRQLPKLTLKSGFTVRAAAIEGSLYNQLVIHDLQLGDPQGVFAMVPRTELDWRPRDLIGKLLTIRSTHASQTTLLRMPHFNPTDDPRLLPDLDIVVGDLRIDRLDLAPAVAGRAHEISLHAKTDIRAGRVLLDLDAKAPTGGDTVLLKIDAEPDNDRFDMDAHIDAPVGGVIDGLSGLKRPLSLRIVGDGKWSAWRGTLAANSAGQVLAKLDLMADKGNFTLTGQVQPGPLLDGPAARLTAKLVNVRATAKLVDRVAQTDIHLDSNALMVDANGQIDFADERLLGIKLNARLLQPAALHPRINGRDVALQAKVAGTFKHPLVDYALVAPQIGFGSYQLAGARASGIADLGKSPLVIPIAVTAQRVLGIGAAVEPLLTNVRADGILRFNGSNLAAEALTLKSDRLSAKGNALVTMATGDFKLILDAAIPRYVIADTGTADLAGSVQVVGVGAAIRTNGTLSAQVTRLDNATLTKLFGGNPRITSAIAIAPDLSVNFTGTKIVAPALTLVGSGSQSAKGVVNVSAQGQLRDYGPVALALAGPIDQPVVTVSLARPGLGIDLANVEARIAPAPGGWSFGGGAASRYGPITANGLIRTAKGPLVVDLTDLRFAGLRGHGSALVTPAGPLSGRFDIDGRGIDGAIQLSAAGSAQRLDAALKATNAKLALDPPVSIASGSIDASAVLGDTGQLTANATLHFSKVRRGDNELFDMAGELHYADGHGHADIKASGDAGSPFMVAARADLAGDQITINGDGAVDSHQVRLAHPAVLSRRGNDWILAPTTITMADGRAEISGTFGRDFALHSKLDRLGLSLLTIAYPSLDLTGSLSGTIDVNFPADGALPTGNASLRVNGLSRAGFATASSRIDVGINAMIANGSASARAVFARAGRIEGRAQAVLPVIPGGRADPLLTRLLASPLNAQLRWSGPAQALWPLSGIEAIDVRGPVTIAADISGVLGDPDFSGTIGAEGARVESTAIGLVIDKISLDSRFSASRLDITRFSGQAGKDGTISGSGGIDLSAVRNFPLDFRLALKNALLVNRDDLHISATGPVHIENGADGARISGKLSIDRARLAIGGTSVEDVPVLAVREVNRDSIRRAVLPVAKPTIWQLDLDVHANNKVEVRGMGLDSEWSGDVKVSGSAVAPRLVGKVTLVRGDYDFAGKRFTLTRGDVRFAGGFPPDPTILITAENTSSSLTATLNISGTALHPQISFSSVPALPEDEVLSRVLFGESITNLSAPEALQLAGALATLRGGSGGLNPINLVRKGLGIDRLRILPADTVKGRKTSIAAGEYIGDRVYIEVTSDAQGYNATSVEVSLTRTLSILSEVATLGGSSVNLRWKRDY